MLGRGMAEAGQRNLDCETYEAATASAKQGLKNATYSTSVEEEKKRSEKGEPNTNICAHVCFFHYWRSVPPEASHLCVCN